jgi:integrase
LDKFDIVDNWLNSVSYSHSQSKATEDQYKRVWRRFASYIGKTAEQILAEYEASDDRTFKRKYAQYIRAWIANLPKEGLGITSIKVMVGVVKSFFKYNDLPLGLVPQSMSGTIYHNRDITKEEIVQIMAVSKIREKAFFTIMAQSGLRPHTIRQLRLKNFEPLDKLPCKIEVPKEITKGKFGSYVTFIGPDAIKYLNQYLATRTNLTQDSLVFCSHDDSTKPVNVKDVSRAFRLGARKLEKTGALHFEVREGKPSELRLYVLRKFFRKYANQMGFEHVNYMMGHTTRGSDSSYTPKDPEFYRELYKEKAMPFLRLETNTPTETEKTIEKLKEQISNKDQKLQELEQKIMKFEPLFELLSNTDNLERLLKDLRQGQYAKVENERSITMQIPKTVIEKLVEQAKAKGEDRVEFTLDQLKKMSIEDSEKDKEDREEETD